jgi:hypothetical protein
LITPCYFRKSSTEKRDSFGSSAEKESIDRSLVGIISSAIDPLSSSSGVEEEADSALVIMNRSKRERRLREVCSKQMLEAGGCRMLVKVWPCHPLSLSLSLSE